MTKTTCRFSILLFISLASVSWAQQADSPHSVLFQTMIRLDNLFPKEPVSISAQYEYALLKNHSLWTQLAWFRDPAILQSDRGVGGVAAAIGYRYYFSDFHEGWYVGPFFDLVRYTHVGSSKTFFGGRFYTTFDFGVYGGHKWTTGPLIFDLAIRTAFFSPESPEYGGYFPSTRQSRFNSHLLISMGLAL